MSRLASLVWFFALGLASCGTHSAAQSSSGQASTGVAPGSGVSSGGGVGSGATVGSGTAVSMSGSGGTSGAMSSGSATGGSSGASSAGASGGGVGSGMVSSGTAGSGVPSGSSTSGTAGSTGTGSGASSGSAASTGSMDSGLPPVGGGLGAAQFAAGELDSTSHGGTITFEQIGAAGWYRSRRDPTTGPCDLVNMPGCCMTKYTIAGNQLTPWDEDLVMTLRGPLALKQFAAYEPAAAGASWQLVSAWDSRSPSSAQGIAFTGKATGTTSAFAGTVGSVCLVNASTSQVFPCGKGSVPFCPTPPPADHYYGWSGSKLIVMLMTMPRQSAIQNAAACAATTNGWYDAPWIGLSIGELVREGAFSPCNCYANTNPNSGDGCGQFNVFEVINDNNAYTNFNVFSTNFFGYGGYVGGGPCPGCNVTTAGPLADLINKSTSMEATAGIISTQGTPTMPGMGPTAALRRPEAGYRYFIMLFDVASRTVQLAIVHPQAVPASIGALLPGLPASVPQAAITSLLALRLPM